MEIWVFITIAAAFFQNLRSALQKSLKSKLSTWGATGARFVFAAPLALLLLLAVIATTDQAVPELSLAFFVFGILGGISQILATGLLIHLFSFKNFTVATAFTKTEPIQVAIFGIIILGDQISMAGTMAILASLIGVGLISLPKDRLKGESFFDRKALIGIASGALFGLSAVAYRGASLSLLDGDVSMRAITTLAFVTSFQALVILIWIAVKEAGQVTLLMKNWRMSSLVGLTGMLGSLAWITAFTMENAAHVRVVGQIEIVFMVIVSVFVFKERILAREMMGLVMVTAGIIGLIAFE